MAMEKVEYSFPHEDDDDKVIEVEPSSAEEIKKANKKDRYLSEEDAKLINQFLKKITLELKESEN